LFILTILQSNPSEGGDTGCDHICEVALAHSQLSFVRDEWVEQWSQFRSALELLHGSGHSAALDKVDIFALECPCCLNVLHWN
jgi:hypothetical protein